MSNAADAIKRAKELAKKRKGNQPAGTSAKTGASPKSTTKKTTTKKTPTKKAPAKKKPAVKVTKKTTKPAKVPKRKTTTKKAPTSKKTPAKKAGVPGAKRGRKRLSQEQRDWNLKQHYHKRRVEQATKAFQNRKDKGVEIPVIVDENPNLEFFRTEDGKGKVRYRIYGLNRFEAIRQTDPDFEPSVADALIRGFAVGVRLDWVDPETKNDKREFHKFNPGDGALWEFIKLSFAKGSRRVETENYTKKKRGKAAI